MSLSTFTPVTIRYELIGMFAGMGRSISSEL